MKKLLFILFVYLSGTLHAQNPLIDSLRKELKKNGSEQTRFAYNFELFVHYVYTSPDSAVTYAEQNMLIARRLKSDSSLFYALNQYQVLSQLTGNFPQALHYGFEALKVAERTKNFILIGYANQGLIEAYLDQGDYTRALFYAIKAKSIIDEHFTLSFTSVRSSDTVGVYINILQKLAVAYEKSNRLDSALKYNQITEQLTKALTGEMEWATIPFVYGDIYSKKGDYRKAIRYYHWGIVMATRQNIKKDIMDNGYGLANAFKKINQMDSSIFYANKVLEASKIARYPLMQLEALALLADVYKAKQNIDSTAKYFELALAIKDSLFNRDKVVQMHNQTFTEQVRQQEMQEDQQKRLYRYRLYALLGGLIVLGIVVVMLYHNNKQKQKAKIKIEEAYEKLKSTQAQLIQSEKMASLGELTAGIAHEIQNPLNFVNNFSEVNTELIDELQKELKTGNAEDAFSISTDIKENEQKILEHGKRADSIVKGMLQHSRISAGHKEPTDINALADEYLRLSYHGFRAKDKDFNATMQTDFDESIGKINVVPQDIGRVLLNLYNNAFYAVQEKAKKSGAEYQPVVTVKTKKTSANMFGSNSSPSGADGLVITVRDNGIGIPQKVVDKIFQPFFTTKPTGQGTGLGLSLSYDIIKAHGGEIRVETKEGEGSSFIILLNN
jgi:signal transduction histidine kinase